MKRATAPLDEEGVRLILEYADSVLHLETLLILWESSGQAWAPVEISARTYVPEHHAMRALHDLERKMLVVRKGADRYAITEEPDRREIVRRITELYRHNLIHVATLLHASSSKALREFSRAFRITGKD